ncbi:MAG: potassium-transporting ATPase subunit KdpC [Verrucomicrobia bacterium]|nr:potassium-transporting ATPase subunit KdpC [Verrucomicrobiota bacterium]
MKAFFASLRPSLISLLLLTVLCGIIYPFFIFCVAQLFFPNSANGSLIYDQKGKPIGSVLLAQNFTKSIYFHPRPSMAGDKGYDARNSSGSNLGPTSKKLIDLLGKRAAAYRAKNNINPATLIPIDAITASGSGLDPHISYRSALLQARRVSLARGMSEEAVRNLIKQYKEWGLFGEARVNVLLLNLALDKQSASYANLKREAVR